MGDGMERAVWADAGQGEEGADAARSPQEARGGPPTHPPGLKTEARDAAGSPCWLAGGPARRGHPGAVTRPRRGASLLPGPGGGTPALAGARSPRRFPRSLHFGDNLTCFTLTFP